METSSFLLFRQMIKYLSWRHRLHRLDLAEYDLQDLKDLPQDRVVNIGVFQTPYIFAQFSCVSFVVISECAGVIQITRLKCTFC